MKVMEQYDTSGASHRYAARSILLTIYGTWFLSLALGTMLYTGEILAEKVHDTPLRYFDLLFRRAGGAIIFVAWALRASIKHFFYWRGQGNREHIWIPAVIYALQAIVRSAIYQLHRLGIIFHPDKWLAYDVPEGHYPHVMSDHILLAATVVGGLAVESVVLTIGLTQRRHWAARHLMIVGATMATVLALLVSAECYVTARYFHPPSEIIIGAVVGLVLFQAPLLLFVVRLLQAHETKDKKVEEHKHN